MRQVEWPGVEIRLHKHSSDNKIFSSSFVLSNQSNRVQCSLYSMTAKSIKPGSNYTKARSREEAQVLHLPTFVNHRLRNILLHIYGPSRIALLVTLLVFTRRRWISYCNNCNKRELSEDPELSGQMSDPDPDRFSSFWPPRSGPKRTEIRELESMSGQKDRTKAVITGGGQVQVQT